MNCLVRVAMALGALAWAASASAGSVPTTLDQQGRVLKLDGTPETGVLQMTFALYDAPSGGAALWSEAQSIKLEAGGFYATALGANKAFAADLWNGRVLYLGITISGESEMVPREPVRSVPYALHAGLADDTTGDIHPNSVSVNGQTVIDANGKLVNATIIANQPLSGNGSMMSPLALPRAAAGSDGFLSSMDFTLFSTVTTKVASVAPGPGILVDGAMTMPRVSVNLGMGPGTVAAGDDPRLSDARAAKPGSADYIQNTQNMMMAQNASFNVMGTGTIGGLVTGGSLNVLGTSLLGGALTVGSSASVTATTNGVDALDVTYNNAGNPAAAAARVVMAQPSNQPVLRLDTATGGNGVDTHGLLITNNAAGAGIKVTRGNATQFVLDAAGNVGVGVAPGAKLDVAGVVRGQWDGALGGTENHAFCVGGKYIYTRYDAAKQCKAINMRLCTLAELGAYTEADYASCCWGWVADPASAQTPATGKAAYFMYSSQTANAIPVGCGGQPGGLRISDNQPNTTLWAAHCCR